MKKNSKRYIELKKKTKDFKSADLNQILELVKKNSTAKFDESIDVSIRIGLKQSKGGDFNLRTVTQLPAGTGKKLKVAVLCEPDKTEEAKKCGADLISLIIREKYFTEDQILDHFKYIGEKSDFPILVHEMPFLSGMNGKQMENHGKQWKTNRKSWKAKKPSIFWP